MDRPVQAFAQVTPEWLTERLRAGDHLDRSVVTGVRLGQRPDHLTRLEVEYSAKEPELPTRFFLKKGDAASCVDREVRFWQETMSLGVAPPTAPCFDAAYDPETEEAHFLTQDITDTHYQRNDLDQSNLRSDSERVIDRLAWIHAVWWDHPRLGSELGDFPGEDNILFFGGPSGYEERLAYAVDLVGDRFPTDRREIYERALRSYPFKDLRGVSRLNPGNRLTTMHGDLDGTNVFYPRDPTQDPVYIIDWALWEVRVGTDDVAQLGLCGHSDPRTNLTRDLVHRYYDGLMRHGVEDYGWEDFWHDYRLSTVRALFKAIMPFRDEERCWVILDRAFDSFRDLSCEELLAS